MTTQKIFFSYSRMDSAFALRLAKDIREAGADIWIDQLDIPAGNHWDSAVEKALISAACVLVILSPSSTSSTNVMDEVSFALESGKKIIPVMLEECLPPFRLRRLQRIDFTKDYNSGLKQLLVSFDLTPAATAAATGSTEGLPDSPGGAEERKESVEKEKESKIWDEACKLNTIAGYEHYLRNMVTGEFKAEAQILINQLRQEQKEDEQEAAAWKKAKADHTLSAYKDYLKTYPDRNYKSLALAAMAELEAREKEVQKKREEERLEAIRQEEARKAEERRLEEARKREEKRQEEERKAEAKRIEDEKRAEAKRLEEKRLEEKRLEAKRLEEKRQEEKKLEEAKKAEAKRLQEEKRLQEKKLEEQRKEEQRKEALRQEEIRKEQKKKEQEQKQAAKASAVAQGGPSAPAGSSKKFIFIGAGVLVVLLLVWLIAGSGGDKKKDQKAWATALDHRDSISFAAYLAQFPKGQYTSAARQKLDSIQIRRQAVRDSITQLAAVVPDVKASHSDPPASTSPTKPDKTDKAGKTANSNPKSKPTPAQKVVSPFKIGQVYRGGIIIYIDDTGLHGLIAADKELGAQNYEGAQKKCANYKGGGYYDWRLPTKEELPKLYAARKDLGLAAKGAYWSSTMDKGSNAWALNMYDGKAGSFSREMSYYVRAIRAF